MKQVCICGAGQIGRFVGVLLASSGRYQANLVDMHSPDAELQSLCLQYSNLSYTQQDVSNQQFVEFLGKGDFDALIVCLPSSLNVQLAEYAKKYRIHYFNLTEDRTVSDEIAEIAADAESAFVLQCGVAPGLVNIIAHHMMQSFDTLKTAKLCVGAIPQQVSNELHYELSWSIDGLVNEYLKTSEVIEDGKLTQVAALSDLEVLDLQGEQYELFHTSGGVGSLITAYHDQIEALHYKTIRYQGHCAFMRDLVERYHHDHDQLVQWYKENVPFTKIDFVLMYISVVGYINEKLIEKSFIRKWYPKSLDSLKNWTAIQWTTASEVCAMCDIVLTKPDQYRGYISHTDIDYDDFICNYFMRYYELEK